jgi:hypothetical protein
MHADAVNVRRLDHRSFLKSVQPLCGFTARGVLAEHFENSLLKVGQRAPEIYADSSPVSHENIVSAENYPEIMTNISDTFAVKMDKTNIPILAEVLGNSEKLGDRRDVYQFPLSKNGKRPIYPRFPLRFLCR